MLAIEVLDEVVFGAREAAWPLIRHDLGLSYAQIGVLLALPGVAGALIEPAFGLLADAGHRRRIVLAGGATFAVGLVFTALAPGFWWLLVALVVVWPASGGFVSLSQASLMDLEPSRHEVNMARWTLAGAVGVVLGPLILTVAVALGGGWRALFLAFAVATLPLLALTARARFPRPAHVSLAAAARGALAALRRRGVLVWLVLVEVTDLMGDVLLGYLALYFVDVVGVSPVVAGAVVVAWTLAGLAGDALLLPILERIPGVTYLRWSAVLVLVLYPGLLLVPGVVSKVVLLAALGLLHAGWYAVPQGRVYTELEGASGTAVALSSVAGAGGYLLPLLIGLVAERAGLRVALWIPLAAPLAILALTRARTPRPPLDTTPV